MNISVIGLGKLGMSMAVAIAAKGHTVIGVDISPNVLDKLRLGQSPIDEPYVQGMLTEALAKGLFSATDDFQYAILKSDISFVVVNTSQAEDRSMDFHQITNACEKIALALRHKTQFHIIAINSTVLPETVTRMLKPLCEEFSHKTYGKDFGLCSNPVFIALTTVVYDFLNPPAVVIGESDSRSGEKLNQFYKSICENQVQILRTTPTMAEFIKMAHNAYATTKMAFINAMADACSRIPDSDIRALSDFFFKGGERSGRFLEAGMGFGGPCFPRDLEIFTHYLKSQTVASALLESISKSNEDHATYMVGLCEEALGRSLENSRIAVLGLSYKPGTDILEDSFSLRLIHQLLTRRAHVSAFDPKITDTSLLPFQRGFRLCLSVQDALMKADCCVLASPLDECKTLSADQIRQWMAHPVIFDPWRILPEACRQHLERYVALGMCKERIRSFHPRWFRIPFYHPSNVLNKKAT